MLGFSKKETQCELMQIGLTIFSVTQMETSAHVSHHLDPCIIAPEDMAHSTERKRINVF